ncbi:MAG: hypothetical protein U1F71_01750 [Verrucomicrobiaceae bacterium]
MRSTQFEPGEDHLPDDLFVGGDGPSYRSAPTATHEMSAATTRASSMASRRAGIDFFK